MRDEDRVLLLGDPRLRQVCLPVEDLEAPETRAAGGRLIRALERFRAEQGFGRAISAPQLGIPRRMIAMNLGDGPFLLVNPEPSGLSAEKFTLWDDCMSFPWLMVRLERHRHLDLRYLDERGETQAWKGVSAAISELLQHEVDHLDGILALDRALDRDSVIARALYLERRQEFDHLVDYTIAPTIQPLP